MEVILLLAKIFR